MFKNIFIIVVSMFLPAICGQETVVQEKPSGVKAMSEISLANNIKTLSSDEFEGRGIDSAGEEKTVNFIENAFKGAGIDPANGDSYTQNVPMVSIEAAPTALITISGGSGENLDFSYMQDHVTWTRRMSDNINVEDFSSRVVRKSQNTSQIARK